MLTKRIRGGVQRGMRQAVLGGRLAVTATSIFSTALILNPIVTAQERFGNFIGTVTDASGAVLSGVTVTLTNKDSNRILTTKTDETGSYVFRQVEPATIVLPLSSPASPKAKWPMR